MDDWLAFWPIGLEIWGQHQKLEPLDILLSVQLTRHDRYLGKDTHVHTYSRTHVLTYTHTKHRYNRHNTIQHNKIKRIKLNIKWNFVFPFFIALIFHFPPVFSSSSSPHTFCRPSPGSCASKWVEGQGSGIKLMASGVMRTKRWCCLLATVVVSSLELLPPWSRGALSDPGRHTRRCPP